MCDTCTSAYIDPSNCVVEMSQCVMVLIMHADVFSMGKLHKDLATTMVECAQDDSKPDQQVIKVMCACSIYCSF